MDDTGTRSPTAGTPRDWARARRAHRALGRASSGSRPSASPTPNSPTEEAHLVRLARRRPARRRWTTWRATASTRARPAELVPGTVRVITARMNYWPPPRRDAASRARPIGNVAYVARYALGRDYHKVLRARLQQLAERIAARGRRVRLSRVHRQRAGARGGARGEGGPRLARQAHAAADARTGSYFFLGEIYTDLPLPVDRRRRRTTAARARAASTSCPTGAIVAPYELDARRCISYLTIELPGSDSRGRCGR